MAKKLKAADANASDAGLPVEASLVAQAAEVSTVPASPSKRWRVSLPWVPPMEIEAAGPDEAAQAYNGLMSILSTEHKHTVTPLD